MPHTVGEDETQGLLVVGKDLFGWAANGSQAVVDALETAHLTSPLEDLDGPLDPVGEDGALEESPRGVEGAEPPPEPRGDPYAAVLECVGTPHLHMAHAAGAGPSIAARPRTIFATALATHAKAGGAGGLHRVRCRFRLFWLDVDSGLALAIVVFRT